MGIRENLQRLIDRKADEIRELEMQVREARVYVQAIQDSIKALPRDAGQVNSGNDQRNLRAGTDIARSRDFIREAGRPLHITELLEKLGKPTDKKNRLSLGGSLAAYVRDGQIFARPAPNTFGLLEFGSDTAKLEPAPVPESFGKVI